MSLERVYLVLSGNDDPVDYESGISSKESKSLGELHPLDDFYNTIEGGREIGPMWRPETKGSKLLRWGIAVSPEHLPKEYIFKGPDRPLMDFFQLQNMALVSEKFKSLVEGLESNTHQFVPVTVLKRSTGEKLGGYYWFVVCRNIDSVNEAHSSFPAREEPFSPLLDQKVSMLWKRPRPVPENHKLVFDKIRIGEANLWRDQYLGGRLRCSDVFKNECVVHGLTGIKFSNGYEAL